MLIILLLVLAIAIGEAYALICILRMLDAADRLKRLCRELDIFLCDEDLTDEKLRDAAEGLLPKLADALRKQLDPWRGISMPKEE